MPNLLMASEREAEKTGIDLTAWNRRPWRSTPDYNGYFIFWIATDARPDGFTEDIDFTWLYETRPVSVYLGNDVKAALANWAAAMIKNAKGKAPALDSKGKIKLIGQTIEHDIYARLKKLPPRLSEPDWFSSPALDKHAEDQMRQADADYLSAMNNAGQKKIAKGKSEDEIVAAIDKAQERAAVERAKAHGEIKRARRAALTEGAEAAGKCVRGFPDNWELEHPMDPKVGRNLVLPRLPKMARKLIDQ